MKIALFFFSFIFLISCSDSIGSRGSDGKSKPSLAAKKRDLKKLSVTGDGTPPKTAIHKAWLVCRDKGEDEYGVPKYDVFVEYDSTSHKVGTCNACAPLDFQSYHDYDIPKEAMAAVGGWFGGAGDYYYVMKTQDDGIRVFGGWQEEGQMEENDTTFHYKKIYEKHPDGAHKFF